LPLYSDEYREGKEVVVGCLCTVTNTEKGKRSW
jgi:hypothetical protein